MQRTDALEDSEISPRKARGIPVGDPPADPREVARARSGPETDSKGTKGEDDRYSFDLDYTDPRGAVWQGTFRAHILTLGDRQRLGLTKARMAQGVPLSNLDLATLNVLEMQAHLAVALDAAPGWWDPLNLRSVGVLAAVYDEVARREESFWAAPAKGTGV